MSDLIKAVSTVVRRCLDIQPDEDVLVIADPGTESIGRALKGETAAAGADAVLAIMDAREQDGTEPARSIAAAMQAVNAYIAPTSRSISHTVARKEATDAGVRGATMPGVTEDMLARVMAGDFDAMARRSHHVAQLLQEGSVAHVSCPRGSHLMLDLSGRTAISDDGDLRAPGAFGNLPCGEGFIAPNGGEGRVVVSSLGGLGLSNEPATLTVHDGHLVSAAGGLGPEFIELLQAHGDAGTNLAELGVGTNDRAQLTGLMLEDEKILGTVHVAFGASAGIGGTVSVPIHLDVVVLDASLDIDGRPVLDNGRYVLEQ